MEQEALHCHVWKIRLPWRVGDVRSPATANTHTTALPWLVASCFLGTYYGIGIKSSDSFIPSTTLWRSHHFVDEDAEAQRGPVTSRGLPATACAVRGQGGRRFQHALRPSCLLLGGGIALTSWESMAASRDVFNGNKDPEARSGARGLGKLSREPSWLSGSRMWTLLGLPLEGRDVDLGAFSGKVLLREPVPAAQLRRQPAPCRRFCSCDVKSPRGQPSQGRAVSIKFHPREALGTGPAHAGCHCRSGPCFVSASLSPGPESLTEPMLLLVLPWPKARKWEFPDLVPGVASSLLFQEPLRLGKHVVAWSAGCSPLRPPGPPPPCAGPGRQENLVGGTSSLISDHRRPRSVGAAA